MAASASSADDAESYTTCTQCMITGSNDSMIVGEVRQSCEEKSSLTQFEQPFAAEKITRGNKF